jgi:hypothetical protein
MKTIFAALLVALLLGNGALAEPTSIKTNVGTFTQTNVFFKPAGWDKEVGGGYAITTNAEGEDQTSLDFESKSTFDLNEDRTISIDMGAKTLSSGAKSFGMMAALTQNYATENGYRSSIFKSHSYTIMPSIFNIENQATGTLSGDNAGGENSNKMSLGDRTFNFGAKSGNKEDTLSEETYDPEIEYVHGFGWENGFDYIDLVDECGLDYTGTLSTSSMLLVD